MTAERATSKAQFCRRVLFTAVASTYPPRRLDTNLVVCGFLLLDKKVGILIDFSNKKMLQYRGASFPGQFSRSWTLPDELVERFLQSGIDLLSSS